MAVASIGRPTRRRTPSWITPMTFQKLNPVLRCSSILLYRPRNEIKQQSTIVSRNTFHSRLQRYIKTFQVFVAQLNKWSCEVDCRWLCFPSSYVEVVNLWSFNFLHSVFSCFHWVDVDFRRFPSCYQTLFCISSHIHQNLLVRPWLPEIRHHWLTDWKRAFGRIALWGAVQVRAWSDEDGSGIFGDVSDVARLECAAWHRWR
jgi:hypothetical protein